MADIGVKFKYGPLPTKIEKADGQLHVTFSAQPSSSQLILLRQKNKPIKKMKF